MSAVIYLKYFLTHHYIVFKVNIIGITIIPIHYGNTTFKRGSVSYHLTFSAEEWSGKGCQFYCP